MAHLIFKFINFFLPRAQKEGPLGVFYQYQHHSSGME